MKKTTILLTIATMTLALWTTSAVAQDVRVRGYDRQDGTRVDSYTRTAPDSTRNNNYSTRGNTNPYTGQEGTKAPGPSDSRPSTYGNSGSLGGGSGFGSTPYGNHGKRGY